MHHVSLVAAICLSAMFASLSLHAAAGHERSFIRSELLFPLETWHNHGSCIVEAPNGDLLVCWFHGSGERTADDVIIEGARLRKGREKWGPRFLMSDTPGFPDGNPCMFIDPQKKLWLFHTAILANTWESALLKVRVSSEYLRDGSPRWEASDVVLLKPGPEFEAEVSRRLPDIERSVESLPLTEKQRSEAHDFITAMRTHATDKLYRRLGWMTRAHPVLVGSKRLILPLYHDGFSFSLMATTDDWGSTWRTSAPLVGAGNIQPSIVQRRDGSLYTLMRDNGPPPQRLLQSDSFDRGETWSGVLDSELPNPGSGADLIALKDGDWVWIGNDTEDGRNPLAIKLSTNEGRTWPWTNYLEKDPPGAESGSYHYPSIIQARDGTIHVSYSYHLNRRSLPKDVDGDPAAKSIKHAHFNKAWITN
jgi:predicted neuraminidase